MDIKDEFIAPFINIENKMFKVLKNLSYLEFLYQECYQKSMDSIKNIVPIRKNEDSKRIIKLWTDLVHLWMKTLNYNNKNSKNFIYYIKYLWKINNDRCFKLLLIPWYIWRYVLWNFSLLLWSDFFVKRVQKINKFHYH